MKTDNGLIIVFTIIIQTFLLLIFSFSIYSTETIARLKHILPWTNLFIVLIAMLAIYSIKQVETAARNEAKARLLKKHVEEMEVLLTKQRIEKHEHGRHLQAVASMLYLGAAEEAREYLDGIADHYHRQEGEIIHTGDQALTALVNSKQSVAETQGIDFAVAVKCSLAHIPLEPWDLHSLLGNLLDNAFEAAVFDRIPRVSLEFKCESGYYVFYVKNNGLTMPRVDNAHIFEAGYTTKGGADRGFGLYIAARILERYGGTLEFINKRHTTAVVKLPGGDENAGGSLKAFCGKAG